MTSLSDWKITPARQPQPGEYEFDLDRALASVVGLRTIVPDDAFTAEALGTERGGHGVVIRDKVILTIGYLITEAEEIWISLGDDRVVPGHPLAYDQVTGFGLVQALGDLEPAGGAARRIGRGEAREPRHHRRLRRPPAFDRGADRRQAGVRRLLGIRARRGDLHRAGASLLGRRGADRPERRAPRHRLAAGGAEDVEAARAASSTWSCRSTS